MNRIKKEEDKMNRDADPHRPEHLLEEDEIVDKEIGKRNKDVDEEIGQDEGWKKWDFVLSGERQAVEVAPERGQPVNRKKDPQIIGGKREEAEVFFESFTGGHKREF